MERVTMIAALAAAGMLASCRSGGLRGDDSAVALNTVSRTFPAEVERVWQSLMASVRDLDLDVKDSAHDALGGQLTARRATGENVYVQMRSVDASNTRVDVAVDPGDRSLAQVVQNRLAARLGAGLPDARAGAMVTGSSTEGTYDQPLDACIAAAERALKELNLPVEARERRDIWAAVQARYIDAVPVNVVMRRTPKDETHVSFAVGSSPSPDNDQVAARLKRAFEAALSKERPQEP